MKVSHLFLVASMLLTPFFMSAQSVIGSWQWEETNSEGKKVKSTITFKQDGTYEVDFGSDGKADVGGPYSMDGTNISIGDDTEGSPCKGITAIYSFKVEGDKATVKMVKDSCTVRAENNDGTPGVLIRVR